VVVSPHPPSQPRHASGRPARSAGPPKRYLFSLNTAGVLGLGGSCSETTANNGFYVYLSLVYSYF
jgi:hypothetical protein